MSLTSKIRNSAWTALGTRWLLVPVMGVFTAPFTLANPSGASVVSGAVSFNGMGSNHLVVNQGSGMAIINWQQFSIAAGQSTTFVQPGVSSIALNRVTGGDPTAIYGALNSNGGVMVINPNGILVGPSGTIDVGGMLTLSTLDITNDDFLNGGANRFQGSTGAGVVNYGSISAGGDVVFMGNFLKNAGAVTGGANVLFGAGGDIIVDQTTDGASISVRGGGLGAATGIDNSGSVSGANVALKSHGNSYAMAINNSGLVRANRIRNGKLVFNSGSGSLINTGTIQARNQDGSGGDVEFSGGNVDLGGVVDASGDTGKLGGSIDVAATQVVIRDGALLDVSGVGAGSVVIDGGQQALIAGEIDAYSAAYSGGAVDITASSVELASTARVDVSSIQDAGKVRIGGGFQGKSTDIVNADSVVVDDGAEIYADSTLIGNGGEVIVWSDDSTEFAGLISAQARGVLGNGGFVEVSGKQTLIFNGVVSTLSANGQSGTLLLDPADVIIGGGSATVSVAGLIGALAGGNVVIHTSGTGGNGDITIADHLNYSSSNSLTLLAHRHIFANYDIQNSDTSGDGHINLLAGWDGATGNPSSAAAASGLTNPSAAVSGNIDYSFIGSSSVLSASGQAGGAGFGTYGNSGGSVFVQPDLSLGAARRAISVGERTW